MKHTAAGNFTLLAGPCVVESKENLFEIAAHLNAVCDTLKIPLVLKASYKKANRSKLSSFTGIGNEKALEILALAGASPETVQTRTTENRDEH